MEKNTAVVKYDASVIGFFQHYEIGAQEDCGVNTLLNVALSVPLSMK